MKRIIYVITKVALLFSPWLAFRISCKYNGSKFNVLKRAHQAFSKVNRVDFFPLAPHESGKRGLIIVIDCKMAIFFYQDGDCFCYDGFETGPYEKGQVTIFDKIKDAPSPYYPQVD